MTVGADPTTASAGVQIDWHAELDLVPMSPDAQEGAMQRPAFDESAP